VSDVTVIGLGAMGSAIANAFLNAGHATTVWNRSHGKMEPLGRSGANCEPDIVKAISESPVCVICIDDYAATWALMEQHKLGDVLAGRTLIQFSTGTPKEARDTEAGAKLHNTAYLDGAILAYPREVGHDALVTVSGEEGIYAGVQGLLAALSTDVRYLGNSIGAAAALDVAVMSYYIMTHLGLVHAALICESEDVRRDMLASVLVDSLPSDTEEIAHLGDALQKNEFSNPGASINVYSNILDRVRDQAADKDIDARIPEFADSLYKEGVRAGYGDEEVVALIKLLRSERN
jgi:3-hydroxyisobutyrate dehydrogenase-like beta-hydroxyacid dehydrogenase